MEGVVDLFTPPRDPAEERTLDRYRRPVARALAEAYVAAFTAPGDLVLDPFCHDATVLSVAAQAGRRAVAVTGNPLLALLARVEAAPAAAGQLEAALRQIRFAPKADALLGEHLDRLYATTCSCCRAPVAADGFVWERDTALPVLVEYRCPGCGHSAREPLPAGEEARHLAGDALGIHRRLVAERLRVDGASPRLLERLLGLYTPRSLYALTALVLKLDLLFADSPLLDPLRAALAQAMDTASTLHAATDEGARPVWSLAPPRLFYEANAWRAFEAAVQAAAGRARPVSLVWAVAPEQAAPGVAYLGMDPLPRLASRLAGQAALVLSQLPRFDPTFAALTYLWSGWLLGKEGSRAALRLLPQRAPGRLRYQGALQAALAALAGMLATEGHLALVFQAPATRYLEGLLIAAGGANLTPVHAWHGLLDDRPAGPLAVRRMEHHLAFVRSRAGPPLGERTAMAARLAVRTAAGVLAGRAEPAPYGALHGPIWVALAREGLFAGSRPAAEAEALRARLEEAVGQALQADEALEAVAVGGEPGEALWRLRPSSAARGTAERAAWGGYGAPGGLWGTAPAGGVAPLADRMEALVREALERGPLHEVALAQEALGPLQGQAVSWPLFQACLHAYGRQGDDGRWALAEAEEAAAAAAWRRRMLEVLAVLGPRLGYEPGEAAGCDLAWTEAGEARIAFRVQASAGLGEASAAAPPVGRRVLVIGERRLALWRHKLAAVPLWRAALAGAGWTFLREAALHALLEGPAERARFEAALGLEEGSGQLTLFSP